MYEAVSCISSVNACQSRVCRAWMHAGLLSLCFEGNPVDVSGSDVLLSVSATLLLYKFVYV